MKASKPNQPDGDTYPRLHQFLRGYLHEDVLPEYGSPEQAALEFRQDANNSEIRDLQTEFAAFMTHSGNRPLKEVNGELKRLGSAWTFTSKEEWNKFVRALLPEEE